MPDSNNYQFRFQQKFRCKFWMSQINLTYACRSVNLLKKKIIEMGKKDA